jgi:hypothetical protein
MGSRNTLVHAGGGGCSRGRDGGGASGLEAAANGEWFFLFNLTVENNFNRASG